MWLKSADVRKRLVKRAKQLGSQKALAEELGISTAYLCDIFKHRREISHELAQKLGLRREMRFWFDPRNRQTKVKTPHKAR